jgi:hypothetical protein
MNRLLVLVSVCSASLLNGADLPDPLPSTEEVVTSLTQADLARAPKLTGYTSVRQYRVENKRFGVRAAMKVEITYRAPNQKTFRILEESGPAPVRKQVFKRMLESEKATARDGEREATQITSRNYEFKLTGIEVIDGRRMFVLEAEPRTKNQFLFRGRIWVDEEDRAIARIEGSPAQSPSFWVKKTKFVHRYQRVGEFWLAESNHSDSEVRMFGHSITSIEYGDYKLDAPPAAAN